MTTLQEIEKAIEGLPRQQFVELARWFDEERNRQWDQQIEADSASGALDRLLHEVERDAAEGRARPTDELCDNS